MLWGEGPALFNPGLFLSLNVEGLTIPRLFYLNPKSASETFLKAQFFFLFYIDLFIALPHALIYPLTYCQSSPVLMLNMGHFR